MLRNVKLIKLARSKDFSPLNRAEALTTNLELFALTHLILGGAGE